MGVISKVSGPVIQAEGMRGNTINELVKVGEMELLGEIIALKGDRASIQVYEETSGLRPGEPVKGTGAPLSAELGPGLLSGVFDGIQRPLETIRAQGGNFIARGISVPSLDRSRKWEFKPVAKKGDAVSEGDVLGEVMEFNVVHKIIVPVGVRGKVTSIDEGKFTVTHEVAEVGGKPVRMMHSWPVRKPRPYKERKPLEPPLITGMRIIDSLFPVAKGGTAAIPGPFGAGKCLGPDVPVLLQDGSVKSMKELYEYAAKNGESKRTVFEETIDLPEQKSLKLFSAVGGRIVPSTSRQFYRSKSDTLLRIRLRSGKTMDVTPVHKLFALQGNGMVVEAQARQLGIGTVIAAARRIPVQEDDTIDLYQFASLSVRDEYVRKELASILSARHGKTLMEISRENGVGYWRLRMLSAGRIVPTVLEVRRLFSYFALPLPKLTKFSAGGKGKVVFLPSLVTPEFAEFIGLFVSEGHVRAGRTVVFTNSEESLLKRFAELCEDLFGLKAKFERRQGKTPNVLASSKALSAFVEELCGKNARGKRVPACIMRCGEGSASAFLEAYFVGDGYFDSDYEVEFCTASKTLQVGLSYLLGRFGVLHTLREREIFGQKYYRVFVRGSQAARLGEKFSGVHHKSARLRAYSQKSGKHYVSMDNVPLSPEFVSMLYEQAGRPYAQLKRAGVEISNYVRNQERMSAGTFKAFARTLFAGNTSGGQNQVQQNRLCALAEALDWLYFDAIVSVQEIPGPHDVYDVVLPGVENFVGGFGGVILHNTVTNITLAKQCDADIIVYIGAGERGNEMSEVLTEFPKLIDPKSGRPLMERTILIANTSNMPVAARESSIYTGITIAEYYRDLGFDVALMADSTSRWAEAMREISGRMEEMPGEEGYPAYLGKRLAEFYERAGRVYCLGSDAKSVREGKGAKDEKGAKEGKDGRHAESGSGKEGKHGRSGSVTAVGAVSPPGGDLSEPVSQNTLRVTKVFWALDSNLSRRRHYPAINWLRSYSLYLNELRPWYSKNVAEDFVELRGQAISLLQQEAELQNIVQLIGPDALPDKERLVLDAAKMLREDFLQQNSFDAADTFSTLKKQYYLLKTILHFYDKAVSALALELPLQKIVDAKEKEEIAKLKLVPEKEIEEKCKALLHSIDSTLGKS